MPLGNPFCALIEATDKLCYTYIRFWQRYGSFVSDLIDDYNSSFYYDNPQNILNAYLYGEVE